MDRLYVVIGVIVLAMVGLGCEKKSEQAKAKPSRGSRVNAVQAKKKPAPPPGAFCDVYNEASQAPDMKWPELDGKPPARSGDGWRWVNVWATWCKPCIEEMPVLVEWRKKLEPVDDLILVSADESRDLVVDFRKKHPKTPESLLMKDFKTLPEWLTDLGMGASGSLPVQILVDGDDKVRCLRAGGISENNFRAVEAMVNGESG